MTTPLRPRPRRIRPVPFVIYDRHKGQPLCAEVRFRPGKLSHARQPRRDVEVYVSIGIDGLAAGIEFWQPVSAAVMLEILEDAFAAEAPLGAEWLAAVQYSARALRWWDRQIASAA